MAPTLPGHDRTRARERFVLASGLVVGLLLIVAALQDLGDPRGAARARASRDARLAGAAAEAAWRDIARRAEAPPGTLDVVEAGGAQERTKVHTEAGAVADDDDGPSWAAAGALLDAALAAEAQGLPVDAISLAREALAFGGEGFPRRFEAHLALARLWTRLDERATAGVHRSAAAGAPPDAAVDCFPVALLAHLVAPVDGAGALAALEAGAADALWPTAAPLVRDGARLVAPEPPAVRAVRGAIEAEVAAPALDAALGVARRRAEAALALLDASGIEAVADEWRVHRTPIGAVAVRGLEGGAVRVAALDRDALHAALVEPALDGVDPLLEVRFGEPLADPLFGPVPILGLDAAVRVAHPAPERSAEPELRRLALVRGGLVLLALMTLSAAVLGARALAEERRLAALRSTFVASVSHDLRTPAQALLLMAEALDEGRVAGDASRAKYHAEIRREAERLRRLVEDLLDGARIDRGEGPRIELAEVAVEPFVDAFEREAGAHAARAGASLTVTRDALPPRLVFDADGVHRALWNLFENALRHGRRGDAPARVRIGFSAEDDALVATVEDDGPGIPAKLRQTVFEPFERVRAQGAGIAADTGTGLGLSIVRAIAVAHGGDATVTDAADGRGARFVATFGAKATGSDTA